MAREQWRERGREHLQRAAWSRHGASGVRRIFARGGAGGEAQSWRWRTAAHSRCREYLAAGAAVVSTGGRTKCILGSWPKAMVPVSSLHRSVPSLSLLVQCAVFSCGDSSRANGESTHAFHTYICPVS